MSGIAIIGGGFMGAGIAHAFAAADEAVCVYEPDEMVRGTIRSRIAETLSMVGEAADLADHVAVTGNLVDAVSNAHFVTEAAPEKLEIKRSIFADLIAHAPRNCILASNSSVIPITHISDGLDTADRMVGTHWWNPPYLIPLVEVIQGARTSDATVAKTMARLTSVGKKPAHVKKDVAGFVANRLQHALWREAIAMVADGVCDARTVDDCVKNSFGLRLAVLGPLENADLVGIELTRDIHRTILAELNRDTGANPILDDMIDEGKLGFKSGEGFQRWAPDEQAVLRSRLVAHLLAAKS